jgi:hypothetical protein
MFGVFMAKKHLFILLQINVCPKGLHKLNTEYYILATNRSWPIYQVGPRNLSTPLETCFLFLMGRNLLLINDLRLRKITYEKIKLFLQNEPNFRKRQIDVSSFITKEYEQMDTWSIRKNEPKTNPNEPKTNPILANKTPIRTQNEPNSNPICWFFK